MSRQIGRRLNERDDWNFEIVRNYIKDDVPYMKVTDADIIRLCLEWAVKKIENGTA